jgi:hypothetical protein
MTREEALQKISEAKPFDPTILEEVFTRLNLNEEEFERILELPRKSYRDYTTYKETFIRLRPFFWLMYKSGYVTRSFYDKFTVRN